MKKTPNQLYWYWSATEGKPKRMSTYGLEGIEEVLRYAEDLLMFSTKEECIIEHLQDKIEGLHLNLNMAASFFEQSVYYHRALNKINKINKNKKSKRWRIK